MGANFRQGVEELDRIGDRHACVDKGEADIRIAGIGQGGGYTRRAQGRMAENRQSLGDAGARAEQQNRA